jgi:hypothetical protein
MMTDVDALGLRNVSDPVISPAGLYLDLLKKTLTGYNCVESCYVELRLHKKMPLLRKMLVSGLLRGGYKVYKVKPFDAEARTLGKDWPCFSYSMVGLKRMHNLQYCIETAIQDGVPGDVIETGVWRGGACIFMRAVLKVHGVTDRTVFVADSFEGLPLPTRKEDVGHDFSEDAFLAVSVEQVQAAFRNFDLLDGQVKFLKGWFKDTLPTADIRQLALLRLDGDLYESTMDVLNALYTKVSQGGFIIVDDYHLWAPCKQAVDDFRGRLNIQDALLEIDGTAVFWRKSA